MLIHYKNWSDQKLTIFSTKPIAFRNYHPLEKAKSPNTLINILVLATSP